MSTSITLQRGSLRAAPRPIAMATVVQGGLLVIAAGLWIVGLLNCWLSLRDPFELELREGTVWLYALAHDAGISVYDTAKVAFLNMNHGPLDPAFKSAIHQVLPGLAPQVVTRAFVGLLPFGLFALFFSGTRRLIPALLWSGGVYLFLLGFGPAQFLIGRSDPTALFFLCALLVAGRVISAAPLAANRDFVIGGIVVGALAAIVSLLNTRYALPAVAVLFASGVDAIVDRPRDSRFPPAARYLTGAVLVAITGFALLVGILFKGNLHLYYDHFFGVFTRASGWGIAGRMPFELFPDELKTGRVLVHLGLALGLLLVATTATSKSSDRLKIATWGIVLAACWVGSAWTLALNHGGGGIYYFAPFYVIAAYVVATRLPWERATRIPLTIMVGLLIIGLPWRATIEQVQVLSHTASSGRQFADDVRSITGGTPVYSEDLHLYETCYRGEVVDIGDMVMRVARAEYFPKPFNALVTRHWDQLRKNPPRFVLVGGRSVISDDLRNLLDQRYDAVACSESLFIANGPVGATLYRLR